jgi:hypothetical protein
MDKNDINTARGLRELLLSIDRAATEILNTSGNNAGMTGMQVSRCAGVIGSYNGLNKKFGTLLAKLGISVEDPSIHSDSGELYKGGTLEVIRNNCKFAINVISSEISNLPVEESDKLNQLRDQIESVRGDEPDLYTHLNTSIEEFENKHNLSASLAAGKVISYGLDQLEGADDVTKARNLVTKRLIKPELEREFVKASRNARAIFSHDIHELPEPSESLNLITSAITISLILGKIKSSKRT